jgi:hypothetical protein
MTEALILLDAFPTIGYTPDGGRYEPARTVVYNDIVQVWTVPMGTADPVVVYEAPALSVTGNRLAGFEILTPDGIVRAINAGGCGCGSKLKTFDPFLGATRKIQRLEARTGG